MIQFDKMDSASAFVVLIPNSLILSEHATLTDARRGRAKSVNQGFLDAVLMKRTARGWILSK
jgi:hypothetical protein